MPATKVLKANSLQLQKQPAVSSSDKASSLAAKVYAVCKTSVPEASTDFSSAAETDEWQVRIVVETPCSWSVQRGRNKSQATVAKTSCKVEPASPSVPPSWPSPQVYQRDQVPGSHTTLMDYLRWDSHITNTTSKASKTRVLGEEPEGGLHDHQGASIQSPG